jgi:hypothetical protein
MIYSKDNPMWVEESGLEVPFSRVTAFERKKERDAASLLKGALQLHEALDAYKERMMKLSREIFEQAMAAAKADAKKSKGNFTWYSFDRSIKIEVNINERIDFDDLDIEAARQKLNEFIASKLSGNDEAIVALINSAFETSHGKLDARKVLGLLKFKSKIKAALFQDAMELIEKSIRKPDSKTYYRISQRNDKGEYEVVNLNFSSI